MDLHMEPATGPAGWTPTSPNSTVPFPAIYISEIAAHALQTLGQRKHLKNGGLGAVLYWKNPWLFHHSNHKYFPNLRNSDFFAAHPQR